MSRRNARETAMKLLYQYDVTGDMFFSDVEEQAGVMDAVRLDSEDVEFVRRITGGFEEKRGEIDGIISAHSHSWKIDRIARVDLAILRMALYEMRYMDTPARVAVNEAVEIAKKYSADKSYQYINGLLGGYLKESGTAGQSE